MSGVLGVCVGEVFGVSGDVVPGVVVEDVVALFEVAGAEFEGVGAFEVVWVWGAGGVVRGLDLFGDGYVVGVRFKGDGHVDSRWRYLVPACLPSGSKEGGKQTATMRGKTIRISLIFLI